MNRLCFPIFIKFNFFAINCPNKLDLFVKKTIIKCSWLGSSAG